MHPIICISGLTAVGTTTLARNLAKHCNSEYVSASTLLLEKAIERGHISAEEAKEPHFWI